MKWSKVMKVGMAASLSILLLSACGANKNANEYEEKSELLEKQILTEEVKQELGGAPAGETGHAVFVSVCDTSDRAHVFTGTGKSLEVAWENADEQAMDYVKKEKLDPVWVKADVVYISETVSEEELGYAILASRKEFLRYGIAFDEQYQTALLEAELNGAKIYEYEQGCLDLNYLNTYLEKADREQVKELPDQYRVFQCFGWMCDEEKQVYELYSSGLEYGRRKIEEVDKEYTADLIDSSMDFLVGLLKEDGSFLYGMYPRFDNEIENYNIVRHAAAIWSMTCQYRMNGDDALVEDMEKAIDYLVENIIYLDDDTAYLYEEKDDEIKLGGSGLAIISMVEFMKATETDEYTDICRKLGNGILTMMDQDSGEYYHVLNGDFTEKEAFRTVYYDGEATFGLCQLYEVTGDQKWLDAAQTAVEHFIEAEYWQYRDHWVAYSMNAITKYIDDPRYYAFALKNAQENLDEIYNRDTTYHTYLELLMATFEVYDRMLERQIITEYIVDFDVQYFLETISVRANRQLNGYFYPEYAMYMENPQRILDAFMVRHDGYRIRIDDIQHNVGGYYLYYKNS